MGSLAARALELLPRNVFFYLLCKAWPPYMATSNSEPFLVTLALVSAQLIPL